MIESWVDFALSVIGGAAAFLCLFDGTRRLFAFGVHRKAVLMTVLAAGVCALYGAFATELFLQSLARCPCRSGTSFLSALTCLARLAKHYDSV